MKAVADLARGASGFAEFMVDGGKAYAPPRYSGSALLFEFTERPSNERHGFAGYLLRKGNYAELTQAGEVFYFPAKLAGKFVAVDIVRGGPNLAGSTGAPSSTATTSGTIDSSPPNLLDGLLRSSVVAGATTDPTAARQISNDVNATSGLVRKFNDEDLEVLG